MPRVFPWWLQAFLLIGALEAIAIGASGWLAPTGSLFPSLFAPVISPLNGRVIGAFYLAGAAGLIASYLTRSAGGARIFVFGFGFIAGSLLIATFAYWSTFTSDHTPIGWLVSYIVDPVVAVIAIIALRLWAPARRGWHRRSPLYAGIAALLIVSGIVLLLAPGFASDHWPWKLTELLARVYACLFIGFGLGAALAAWEAHAAATAAVTVALVALAGFVAVASLRHLDRFKSDQATVVWFCLVGAIGAAALLAAVDLVRERNDRSRPAPATGGAA